MDGAFIYIEGTALPILHNLRDEARAKGNKRLAWALDVAITEYIGGGDKLVEQSVGYYAKACANTPRCR